MEEWIGEISEIKEETFDVKTFGINLDRKIDFIPGQYTMVSIVGNDVLNGQEKPLTFVGIPKTEVIKFTVKKVGKFTTEFDNLNVGDKIKIRGVFGEALNFDTNVEEDVVFLAGGSRITPFMAALNYSVENKMKNKLTLFFSNRTESDIIYKDELNNLNDFENITIVNTLSHEWSSNWKGETGRIDKEMIERDVDKISDKIWYICGPPPMVKGMKELLINMKIDEQKIKIENWEIYGKHDDEKK